MKEADNSLNKVAVAVGWYDLVVGLWPLIAPASFSAAVGTRKALPAARVIGSMWASLGAALLLSSSNRSIIPALGVASTLAGSTLALTQCGLVGANKLPKKFLLQALAETLIGVAWIFTLTSEKTEAKTE